MISLEREWLKKKNIGLNLIPEAIGNKDLGVCVHVCVCVLKAEFLLWWSNTDFEECGWALVLCGSFEEVKSCSEFLLEEQRRKGQLSQGKRPDRGYSTQRKYKHVTLENSTGWTNDGLEEPVEKLRTFSFSSNQLTSATIVKPYNKRRRSLLTVGGSLCEEGHPATRKMCY